MSVRAIRITGDPVLHTPAVAVAQIDGDVRALVADMKDTMAAAPGVGLAAPQVGVALRIFVWNWLDGDGVEHSGTAINPELWISPPPVGDLDEDAESEGCLSLPGDRFALRRSELAVLRATGLDGKTFKVEASGWLARIFQHEFDHLDGVLYADRLAAPLDRAVAKSIRKRGWGTPGLTWMPGIDHPED
ncbi:MAG: peptide deformylase [Pseudolysinimonas sp.]